jgi:ribosome-associated protein
MQIEIIIRELQFKAVRSSGPGGQSVNKTSSKVEVLFDVFSSEGLTAAEKERLSIKLSSRLTNSGILSTQCSESRSQHRNKRICIERLIDLLQEHLKVARPRKKTKPSKSAIEKRLQAKKNRALKKASRKPPKIE